jgi:hypothetical protein
MSKTLEVKMRVLDWTWCDGDDECFVTLEYSDGLLTKPLIYRGIVSIEDMRDLL